MNQRDIGKLISNLRKEAGYTQASLAKALFVTDKAVSKWERGICAPDSSLLTKLSMLLDADIEYLISGQKPYGDNQWVGEIRIEDIEGEIAGKPLVHYLLSYLMLVGITNVYMSTANKEYINRLRLEKYGLNIKFGSAPSGKTFIISDKILIFGANLTRYFQSYMQSGSNIIPVLDDMELPILFTHYPSFSPEWHKQNCEKRVLTRGLVCMPLNEDASKFIKIYEKYQNKKIADLEEVAKNRGLV